MPIISNIGLNEVQQFVLERLRALGWNATPARPDTVAIEFDTACGKKTATATVRPDAGMHGQHWITGSYWSNPTRNEIEACYGLIPLGACDDDVEASIQYFHQTAMQAIDGTYARSLWLSTKAQCADPIRT